MKNVFIDLPAPFRPINIVLDKDDSLYESWQRLRDRVPATLLDECRLFSGDHFAAFDCRSDARLSLQPGLLGGKGGFGSQLRAAGSKMKTNKRVNREAMKDTSGRKLRTLKQAQELVDAVRNAPEREKEQRQQKRDKLLSILNTELPGRGTQIKFDDDDYLTQSETILEDIKDALQASYGNDDSDHSSGSDTNTETQPHSDLQDAYGKGSSSNSAKVSVPRKLAGWDDEIEDEAGYSLSDSSDEDAPVDEKSSSKTYAQEDAAAESDILRNGRSKRRKI